MEDEKRRNDENADHSIKNGAGDVKENKLVGLFLFCGNQIVR